ncbi:MAG: protein kinase, partial [Candidatus Aminicenantes bacterium]|nr:protein kinase [Candidatus Aminicenantes bacterium]
MIGQIISHYKIIEKIGEGGMGVVYKAEDTKLKRVVALKFLPRTLTRNEEARERFMLEAQAAAKLNNPNIVTIHEINDYSGDIYIAMEYVEGETIREKLPPSEIHDTPLEAVDDYKTRKMPPLTQSRRSPLQIKQIVDIAIQVCQGLQAAHKLGIVHRDIKPQNLIINQEGVTKILDFGVAKLTRGTKVTKEYATLGTVHYMSPDQLTGNEIDQRTDIWSLGVVLYEMLTAELPFKHDGMQAIMYAIVNDNPIPPSELRDDVSRELERIILKCLRKDRDNRYHSVEPLLVDLKKVLKSIHKDSQALRLKKKEVRKETERRQATVIFAEIYGYREMLEKFDAEEAASNMNVCFEMFAAAIEKYGGKIDKIMESSLTALFGVPAAIEEAPKQAVNAAIEMRNCLQRFDRESNLKIPLDIRIGINSGMVIAGAIGKDKTKDYTVMGDTITLSSQLKDLSTKGQIYVGQLTYKNTRNYFEYKRLKPFTLKGQTKQIDIFELLSTKEKMHRPKFGSESMIHSEMVGRDKESNKLELFVMKTINGEGAIISVLGEAGMGKSRLLAELKNKDLLKKVMLLEGRALSIGKNLSYHPIINVFKNWANITEEDTEIESISKLETAVSNIYPRGAGEV